MNLNISRVAGEPNLLPGSRAYASASVQAPREYEIETTPTLPGWPRGVNWRKCFNKKLSGDPFLAEHDGVNKITVVCDPGKYPDWLDRVDAAIKETNQQEGTTQYAQ